MADFPTLSQISTCEILTLLQTRSLKQVTFWAVSPYRLLWGTPLGTHCTSIDPPILLADQRCQPKNIEILEIVNFTFSTLEKGFKVELCQFNQKKIIKYLSHSCLAGQTSEVQYCKSKIKSVPQNPYTLQQLRE